MITRKKCPLHVVICSTLASGLGLISPLSHAALEEVIVTAQKRDQSVQEVPVAITALTQESIETNRVTNVNDLSGLAPNLTSRPATGGQGIPVFSMRGVTSTGVVPGSDKEISIYLDGVYIGSPRGSIFGLPDIAQLEVLRGPQGTLFGRNATAGAINITTRDPNGELGLRQDLSFGNEDYKRTRTSIDSPTWGPFSFLATYSKEERDGDVKNLGAGTVWDRTAFGKGYYTSPKKLGEKNTETYFLAAKFQPTDSWTMTYKYDKSNEHGSPNATALVAIGTPASGGAGAAALAAIYGMQTNPPPLAANGRRPDAVNNAFTSPIDQTTSGHSLTTLIDVNDNVAIKNITAFRKAEVAASTDLTGFGGMTIPGLGPICIICSQGDSDSDQWSTELQVNWDADWGTLTVGALYFESDDRAGGPLGGPATSTFKVWPGYVIPAGEDSVSFNDAQSLAAYTQLEYHLTDEIDLVVGARETRDRKSGKYRSGIAPNGTPQPVTDTSFDFEESRPSYVLGVNYKPTYDTLIYGKYSNAFVSGGSTAGIAYDSEIAKSWEAGVKSDFMNSRLRSNFSIFYVDYDDLQWPVSGVNINRPDISVAIVTQGKSTAKGFEWEGSASVIDGLTLNASAGYTDVEFGSVNPVLTDSVQVTGPAALPNSSYNPTLTPDWTGSLSTQYDSVPLFGESYLSFIVSGNWHSKIRMEPNPARSDAAPGFDKGEYSAASWVVNSRLALKEIDMGFGGGKGEIALWGRNLTDNDYPNYALNFGGLSLGANYMEARSYGVDLSVQF